MSSRRMSQNFGWTGRGQWNQVSRFLAIISLEKELN
jgi:hypothetical protein